MWGEFIVTGEFPAQSAINAQNVSIWWRHAELPGEPHTLDKIFGRLNIKMS